MEMARLTDQDLLRKSDNYQFSRFNQKQDDLYIPKNESEFIASVDAGVPSSAVKMPFQSIGITMSTKDL